MEGCIQNPLNQGHYAQICQLFAAFKQETKKNSQTEPSFVLTIPPFLIPLCISL